jgi:hypothetical protein
MRRAWLLALISATGVALGLAACGTFSGSDTAASDDAGGSTAESGGADAGEGDGGASADGGPVVTSSLGDTSKWSFFDTKDTSAATSGFAGATFDGHGRVFFPPKVGGSGLMAVLDTSMDFKSATSWTVVDVGAMAGVKEVRGVMSDGDYVYFAPAEGSRLARFHVGGALADTNSWESFSIDAKILTDGGDAGGYPAGFSGVVRVGTDVYFTPSTFNGGAASSFVVRYDTTQSFGASAAWSVKDVSSSPGGTSGAMQGRFTGAASTGKYVFFGAAPTGIQKIARLDVAGGAWSILDPAAGTAGLQTSVLYDGHHVHFTPTGSGERMLRLDPGGSITGNAAWSYTRAPYADGGSGLNFAGAAFDGYNLYLVPSHRFGSSAGAGLTLRTSLNAYPTDGGPAAWEGLDLSTLNPRATGFGGAAYDGRYVYFAPNVDTVVARFEAHPTAESPPPLSPYSSP